MKEPLDPQIAYALKSAMKEIRRSVIWMKIGAPTNTIVVPREINLPGGKIQIAEGPEAFEILITLPKAKP